MNYLIEALMNGVESSLPGYVFPEIVIIWYLFQFLQLYVLLSGNFFTVLVIYAVFHTQNELLMY